MDFVSVMLTHLMTPEERSHALRFIPSEMAKSLDVQTLKIHGPAIYLHLKGNNFQSAVRCRCIEHVLCKRLKLLGGSGPEPRPTWWRRMYLLR
jgi:hypothetical protein